MGKWDLLVFSCYFALVLGMAIWASRVPKDHSRNTEDYFLAGRSLPWWIIGFSLIAANISTEQIIGMNGTAFVSGIAVISYSWIGASIPQLLVAKFFLPTFLRLKIYSMPQFLEVRFDHRVSIGMGVFWLLVYVFVNLTSVLYLGALSLRTLLGLPLIYGILGLALLSALYTVYGGLSPVAWTDFVQVSVLISGGILVTWFGLDAVGGGNGALAGFSSLLQQIPDRFHTVLGASHPDLPWPGVFMGGLWIAAVSYWGCNQYIIQKALAAKNVTQAQYGLLLASFLSLIVSVIIVLPGVIASVLLPDVIQRADEAYPTLIRELIPEGFTGLIVAALVAAIISSLNSMTNSAATIFTMDVYRRVLRKGGSEREYVLVGRIASASVLLIAVSIAPQLTDLRQAFQFIQEYTGFVTPGVMTIFLFGLGWRGANASGALMTVLLTIPVSLVLKLLLPATGFLNRMGIAFAILSLVLISVSWKMRERELPPTTMTVHAGPQETPLLFNVLALLMVGTIAVLYLVFW